MFLLEILKQERVTLADNKPVGLSALDSAGGFLAGDVDVVLVGMFAPSFQLARCHCTALKASTSQCSRDADSQELHYKTCIANGSACVLLVSSALPRTWFKVGQYSPRERACDNEVHFAPM